MPNEQAEPLVESEVSEEQEPATPENEDISDILSEALKETQATPDEAGAGTEEAKEKEQVPAKKEEPPFLELLVNDATKLPFKTEEEFHQFLDKNQVLKDGWLRQADLKRV